MHFNSSKFDRTCVRDRNVVKMALFLLVSTLWQALVPSNMVLAVWHDCGLIRILKQKSTSLMHFYSNKFDRTCVRDRNVVKMALFLLVPTLWQALVPSNMVLAA